jgi:predicted 2-oxoglutarate/Fe(II)-dependent dioxygenase YbiX
MNRAPRTPAEIFRGEYRVDETIRRSDEVDADGPTLEVVQQAIAALQSTLSQYFGMPLSGFEGVGLLRYRAGGFYRTHRDVLPAAAGFANRLLSVVLFLTGSALDASTAGDSLCVGGALRVFTDDAGEAFVDIAPQTGTRVAFPAALLHEVRPVIAGVRDVAVDWAIGK